LLQNEAEAKPLSDAIQKIFTITLTQFKLIQQSSLLLLAALIASKEQGLQSGRLGTKL